MMNKLFLAGILMLLLGCSSKKTEESVTPGADTIMDSTAIKMRADTTIKQLNNLEDSINIERQKAAQKAN